MAKEKAYDESAIQTMDAQMAIREKDAVTSKQAFFSDQVDFNDKAHPDWAKNGNKLGEIAMNEVHAYALRERFSPEMMSILDYGQAIHTIWKAVQYDKAQTAKPALRKKLRRLPKTLRATARSAETAPREERKKRRDALVAAHNEQGTVASAAALFENLSP